MTGLYHEIEEYDGNATGTLVAWVKIDSLPMDDTYSGDDNNIYMYYGNACISNPTEAPDNVWDANFKGVWHLNQRPTPRPLISTRIRRPTTSTGR